MDAEDDLQETKSDNSFSGAAADFAVSGGLDQPEKETEVNPQEGTEQQSEARTTALSLPTKRMLF